MIKNHSNWREDLREVVDIESSKPETEAKSEVKIGDKKVTNKITINPVMKEAFGEIGALVVEVTELEEEEVDPEQKKQLKAKEQMMRKQQMLSRQRIQMQKQGRLPMGHTEGLDMKKADMGEVITDFRKSDAPQFKGKSDKKKQQMAIAAKLNAEETEDGLRDRRMERGGVDGNNRYNKPVSNTPNTFGKKKPAGGPSALERVKANIRAKHGKDAIIDTKKSN
jgi:hypothetical protein